MASFPWELKAPQYIGFFLSFYFSPFIIYNFFFSRGSFDWRIKWMGNSKRYHFKSKKSGEENGERKFILTFIFIFIFIFSWLEN